MSEAVKLSIGENSGTVVNFRPNITGTSTFSISGGEEAVLYSTKTGWKLDWEATRKRHLIATIRRLNPTNINRMVTICKGIHYKFGCRNAAKCGCFEPVKIMIADSKRFNYNREKKKADENKVR